jgi:hypothetical protein
MKESVATGIAIAVGFALYEIVVHGFAGADWYRVVFVGVFSAVTLVLIKVLRSRSSL